MVFRLVIFAVLTQNVSVVLACIIMAIHFSVSSFPSLFYDIETVIRKYTDMHL